MARVLSSACVHTTREDHCPARLRVSRLKSGSELLSIEVLATANTRPLSSPTSDLRLMWSSAPSGCWYTTWVVHCRSSVPSWCHAQYIVSCDASWLLQSTPI